MNAQFFTSLKEIKSLWDQSDFISKKIKEEKERIEKIRKTIQETEHEIDFLGHEFTSLKHQIFEVETKLKTFSEQKQRMISFGELDITSLEERISESENQGMVLLELEEKTEIQLKEKNEFLTGIKKTFEEIGQEVEDNIQQYYQEMKNISLRVELLESELPENFKNTLHRLKMKNLIHGPFTQVQNGHCFLCRYKISRIEESEIDLQKSFKTCPQCMRIFLPYGL